MGPTPIVLRLLQEEQHKYYAAKEEQIDSEAKVVEEELMD